MSNISFANPWLLLLVIPFLAVVIVGFFLATTKESRTKNNIYSFACHIVIVCLLTLVFAGTIFEMVITKTSIYILADVSYSANENLEKIDEYIADLEKTSPRNSEIGVICFAKDYELLVELGEELVSVKNSKVDNSATDIVGALEYAGSLFTDDVIKRIVIISDGKETNKSNIVSVVNALTKDDIYIDAIYLDNNLTNDAKEIQINQVEYVKSTYLNRVEKVNVLVQTNQDCDAMIELYLNGELYETHAPKLTKGFNIVNFELKTDEAANNHYEIKIKPRNAQDDTSQFNNALSFDQKVTERGNILVISDAREDLEQLKTLYNTDFDVTYFKGNRYDKRFEKGVDVTPENANSLKLPYTVEELVQYDEYIISNIDLRILDNHIQFLESLDICISEFGKSLTTMGNVYIQSDENFGDEALTMLSDLLPTKYGNDDQDSKLVGIVFDISRSMEQLDRFKMAKIAAKAIVDLLKEGDRIMMVGFYGSVEVMQNVKKVVEDTTVVPEEEIDLVVTKSELKEIIENATPKQGTFLGAGLKEAYDKIVDINILDKELFLISDGRPYGADEVTAIGVANDLAKAGIQVSSINTFDENGELLLQTIADKTGGNYYYATDLDSINDLVLNDIKDDLKDTVIEGNFAVKIEKAKDDTVEGITSLPNINGFYYNVPKANATSILTTTYTTSSNREYVVPIYASWNYGSGKVASFATNPSGAWLLNWQSDLNAHTFFVNQVNANMPTERIDSAFIVDVNLTGSFADLTVNAPSLNINSVLTATITNPKGDIIEKTLVFDSENYVTNFEAEETGKYQIELTYVLGNLTYHTSYEFDLAYLPEYNEFTQYEASNLYYMVSENGQVSEDGQLELVNDNSYVMTYTLDFTPILMIICVTLFIVDIIIRKFRWADIKALFKKKTVGGSKSEKNS